jgi:hypothetical protein
LESVYAGNRIVGSNPTLTAYRAKDGLSAPGPAGPLETNWKQRLPERGLGHPLKGRAFLAGSKTKRRGSWATLTAASLPRLWPLAAMTPRQKARRKWRGGTAQGITGREFGRPCSTPSRPSSCAPGPRRERPLSAQALGGYAAVSGARLSWSKASSSASRRVGASAKLCLSASVSSPKRSIVTAQSSAALASIWTFKADFPSANAASRSTNSLPSILQPSYAQYDRVSKCSVAKAST